MSGHHHLLRRGGVYYYRRRVPVHLIQAIGKKFIQLSLDTTKLKEARKLRVAKDLEWDARFDALGNGPDSVRSPDNGTKIAVNGPSWSERELAELVRDYVERLDERFRVRLLNDPPESEEQKEEMRVEAQFERIIRDRNHPDGHRSVYLAGKEILGSFVDDPTLPQEFWELVRRALLELSRRSLAQLDDDHQRAFFDQLFHPARPPEVSFGELAEQFLDYAAEEAAANRTSQKWIDKQRAILSLLREIIGDKTTVHNIDHDTCLRVRSMLARTPANRTKIYGALPLDQAIERAAAEQRNLLSPVTQEQYLSSLRDVLDLAAKKRLISVNPAQGLKPLKRDTIPAGDKRRPFTIEQIKQFFGSKYYAECAKHPVPFAHDKSGWRFWLPLICLFMGMRPNEVAQMLVEDLKRSSKGTRYLDVAATADDDDGDHVSSPERTARLQDHPRNGRASRSPADAPDRHCGGSRRFADRRPRPRSCGGSTWPSACWRAHKIVIRQRAAVKPRPTRSRSRACRTASDQTRRATIIHGFPPPTRGAHAAMAATPTALSP